MTLNDLLMYCINVDTDTKLVLVNTDGDTIFEGSMHWLTGKYLESKVQLFFVKGRTLEVWL